ncbi:MAG: MliC family protein [Rikenellaceae bacterium]
MMKYFILTSILFIAACSSVGQKQNKEVAKNTNEVIFLGSEQTAGKAVQDKLHKIEVTFTNSTAIIYFEGKRDTLDTYRTASGYGYSKADIDLRGKGKEAKLTLADGRSFNLIEKDK